MCVHSSHSSVKLVVRPAHAVRAQALHSRCMEKQSGIGDRIRQLRREVGLKQADFVAGLDISRSYLSKIESGEEQPGRELLIRVSHEYGVSLDWITSGVGNMKPARAITEQEAVLLQAFRSLPADEAETHLKLMLQRVNKSHQKDS